MPEFLILIFTDSKQKITKSLYSLLALLLKYSARLHISKGMDSGKDLILSSFLHLEF